MLMMRVWRCLGLGCGDVDDEGMEMMRARVW